MIKVKHKDLEEITKFLDKIAKKEDFSENSFIDVIKMAEKLSKMIKENYTEIKPDYEE